MEYRSPDVIFEVEIIQFDPLVFVSKTLHYPADLSFIYEQAVVESCLIEIDVSKNAESLQVLLMFITGEQAYIRLLEHSNFIVCDPSLKDPRTIEFFDVNKDESSKLVQTEFFVPLKYTLSRKQALEFLKEWLLTGNVIAPLQQVEEPQD